MILSVVEIIIEMKITFEKDTLPWAAYKLNLFRKLLTIAIFVYV